jgi:hypothetical protein
MLRWIGEPQDENVGLSETFSAVIDPTKLLAISPEYPNPGDPITAVVTPDAATGTGAPYTSPFEWRLNGDILSPNLSGMTLTPMTLTYTIDTTPLSAGRHELTLIATGSDGKHYTAAASFVVEK